MGDHETRAEARSSARTPPAGASEAAVRPRTVIVPRRPGLLREYQPRSPRRRDELDELVDELFDPTTDEKPGRFDAGLAVVGLSLVAWATILGGPSVALWIGISAIVLGLALPARAVLRRFDLSRSGGLRRRTIDRGLPLDASQPATLALIDAYARLMQMSCMQGTGNPKQAVSAGHAAVVEVARRLDGQAPVSPAKVRFVSKRTDALEALTRQMLRSHDRWLAQTATQPPAWAARTGSTSPAYPDRASIDAPVLSSAIAEFDKLNDQLRKEVESGGG